MEEVHRDSKPNLRDFKNALKRMTNIAGGDFFIMFFFQNLFYFSGLFL